MRTTSSSPTATGPRTGTSSWPLAVVCFVQSVFTSLSGVPSCGVTFAMSSRYCQCTLPQLTPSSVFLTVISPIAGLIAAGANFCS
ncbi:MAG: hypothetical protein BWX86_01711 [Verrucomicrobia bacterium ADurb.Bin122]|nr:MAG: hypothetical protein BWX86_01711 [Verrucomicrobia bacterium ADurb.Bin122]